MMVEGTPILRQSSTNGFLVWSLEFSMWRWLILLWSLSRKNTAHTTWTYTSFCSNSTIKWTTFTWKNFNDYTRNSLAERCLRIGVPSTIIWYINIRMNRCLIHSKLQFTCVCIQADTNTPNVYVYKQIVIHKMCD